ncbi:MAG: 1-acyl-sn-glycerol-3-phosphate acyltransferase [Ferruginibacter sp.]
MRIFFLWWFKLKGWKIEGTLPEGYKKCVVIAAPHTSNWDFIYSMAVFVKLKIPIRFLAKKELFVWPFSSLLKQMGAIAVQRNKRNKLVDDIIALFKKEKELMLMIPAEGTRSSVTRWKSGFYHVALGANVPVLLGFLDYKNKIAGFGPLLYLSGNPVTDATTIKNFYRNIKGKHPENFDVEALVLE